MTIRRRYPVLPDSSAAEVAARWAVRLDGDQVSAEERRAFEQWRNASSENAAA